MTWMNKFTSKTKGLPENLSQRLQHSFLWETISINEPGNFVTNDLQLCLINMINTCQEHWKPLHLGLAAQWTHLFSFFHFYFLANVSIWQRPSIGIIWDDVSLFYITLSCWQLTLTRPRTVITSNSVIIPDDLLSNLSKASLIFSTRLSSS